MAPRILKRDLKALAELLNIDTNVVSLDTLKHGMKIEFEHGKIDIRTNVTSDDMIMTAKIALAHLQEYPDYYIELEKMEKKLHKKWNGKMKPSVFKT